MNWVRLRKEAYLWVLLSSFAACALIAILWREPVVWLAIGLVLLLPGRVGAYLLKDLYASRALLASGSLAGAANAAELAIDKLERQPWRRWGLFLSYPVYTLSAKAMAYNNLGAACLEMGELSRARDELDAAMSIDARYPMPAFNLALLEGLEGRLDLASYWAAKASELGMPGDGYDAQLRRLGDQFAQIQASHPSP